MVNQLYSKKFKGQMFSFDLFLAIVIFIFVVQLYMMTWGRSALGVTAKVDRTEMEKLTLDVSDLLIKSRGLPTHWNETTVSVIGLAEEDHVLDGNKTSTFVNLDVGKTKGLLGIENLNFTFTLKDENGIVLEDYGSHPIDAEEVVILRRLVLYDNNITFMEFGLWK